MSPEQIRVAFAAGRVTIFSWDMVTGRTRVHPLSANLPNEPRSPIWNSYLEFLDDIHPEDRPAVVEKMERSLATGNNFEVAFRVAAPQRHWRWLGVRAAVRRDDAGTPLEISGISVDLTEERNRELEVARRESAISSLIDSLNGIVWEADPETFQFLFVSRQAERILGFPLEEWLQPGFWVSRLHPGDAARSIEFYTQATARREDHNFEYRMIARDGRVVWLHDSGAVQQTPGGVLRRRGVMVDITSQKEAEQARRESEAIFDLVFDQSPAGLIIFDATAARLRVNSAYYRFLGRTEEEVMSTSFVDRVHPLDRERAIQIVDDLDHGRPVDAELRFQRPDGEVVWGRMVASRTFAGGKLYKGLSIVEDITAQKRTEELLKQSHENFRSIANDTPAFLWMSSPEGRNVFVNRAIVSYHGIDGAALDGDPFQYYHPDDRETARADIEQAVRNRAAGVHESRILRADGEYRWMLNRYVPRFADSGEFLGHVGAAFDITERKIAEQQLQAAHDRLAAELRERAHLQEELSHLSRRLINAQEEERRRVARELHDSVGNEIAAMSLSLSTSSRKSGAPNAAQLGRMLSDMAQSIRGISHQLHPAMLEFAGLAAALRELCREFAKLTGVQVKVVEPEDLGSVSSETSLCAYRVTQEALQNVARHSAAKYAIVSLLRENDNLKLTIHDRGVGFDPAQKQSGLGLISIRERVRLLSGTLEIDSQPGEGATLTITVPC